MTISKEKKDEVRVAASQASRRYQATRVVGVVLYDDNQYGALIYGHSGSDLDDRKILIVKEHHNILGFRVAELKKNNKKPSAPDLAFKDAEVNVFNSAGQECIYWKKSNIKPKAMYLHIIGPHPMCKSCKRLMKKFSQSFDLDISKIEVSHHQTAH
ncbi:hypothetical protein ACLUTX_00105 [Enterobacterales bacterium AE_CKDN230030158-1A_HGKHYDSX7]